MVLDHDQHQESLPGIRTDRNSLVVPWLGLRASTAGGLGSIPRWGTKIPHAHGSAKKKKKFIWNLRTKDVQPEQ